MAGRSHRLRPRPGVEIVDMILDKATVAAENRAFTGAPQPLQQAAGELQIGCRLVGVEVGRAAFRAVRPGNIIVAIHVVRPSLRGDGIAPSLSPRLPDAPPAGARPNSPPRCRTPPGWRQRRVAAWGGPRAD